MSHIVRDLSLGCFAAVLLVVGSAQALEQTKIGDWSILSETDPFTDKTTVSVIMTTCTRPDETQDALSVWYEGGALQFVIVPATGTGSNEGPIQVEFRIDREPHISSSRWRRMIRSGFFLREETELAALVDGCKSGSTILFRWIDARSDGSHVMKFSLRGFTAAFSRLSAER